MQFIYVFDTEVRDELEKLGYILLKNDEQNSIFVFKNDDRLVFDMESNSYVFSDTLTF